VDQEIAKLQWGFYPNLFEFEIRSIKFWLKPSVFTSIIFTALKGGAIQKMKVTE